MHAAITKCEAKSEGLVRYPLTMAPISGSVTVTAQCADNAHMTSSSLSVMCTSDGSWSEVPQCHCDTGYHAVAVSGRQLCQGKKTFFRKKNIMWLSTYCSCCPL